MPDLPGRQIRHLSWRRRRDSNHRTAFDRYTIPNRAYLNISSKRYRFLYRFFSLLTLIHRQNGTSVCEMVHVMPFRCIYLLKNSISKSNFKTQTRCSATGLNCLDLFTCFFNRISDRRRGSPPRRSRLSSPCPRPRADPPEGLSRALSPALPHDRPHISCRREALH